MPLLRSKQIRKKNSQWNSSHLRLVNPCTGTSLNDILPNLFSGVIPSLIVFYGELRYYLDYVPDALIVDLSDPTLIEKRLKQCTHPIVKFVSVTHEIVYSYARSMELTFPITMNFYLSHWK